MNSTIIMDLIYLAGIVLFGLLMILIPIKALAAVTTPFSFKTFGIRRVKRLNSWADSLGTCMIVISMLLAFLFPLIPFSPLVYGIWLTFTWLCALSRAVRLSQVPQLWKKEMVVFLLSVFYGIALICSLGFLNDFVFWSRSVMFFQDLFSKDAWHVMYYLNSPRFLSYLMQAFMMALSTGFLWGQFKFMRLDNTFHGANIFTYTLKTIFWSVLVAVLALISPKVLERAYQVPAEEISRSHLTGFPYDLSMDSDFGFKQEDEDAGQKPESAPENSEEQKPEEKTDKENTGSDQKQPENSQTETGDENQPENPASSAMESDQPGNV